MCIYPARSSKAARINSTLIFFLLVEEKKLPANDGVLMNHTFANGNLSEIDGMSKIVALNNNRSQQKNSYRDNEANKHI